MPGYDVSAIAEGIWTPYTPSWTSSGTAPAIGNGTIIGSFILQDRLLIGHIYLAMGSTTTFGTGTYRFGLPSPFTCKSGYHQTCPVVANDSGTGFRTGTGRPGANDAYFTVMTNDALLAVEWTNTVPHTWANGDEIYANYMIEIN